jgi:hypothetical protein
MLISLASNAQTYQASKNKEDIHTIRGKKIVANNYGHLSFGDCIQVDAKN